MMYQQLFLIAECLGMVPVKVYNLKNPKILIKFLNILLNLMLLALMFYGLFVRVALYFDNGQHLKTMIVLDFIEVFNEFLSLSSICIIPYLYKNEWRLFLHYLQHYSKNVESILYCMDIGFSMFAIIGTAAVNCYQFIYLHLKKGYLNAAYYSFYICSVYDIFLIAFLSLIGHIIIGHQQTILNYLQHTKTYFANEKCFHVSSPKSYINFSNDMKKITNEFAYVCTNIKKLNLLYGWQMLFLFSAGVINITLFINFSVFHKSVNKNAMMVVTNSFRIVFYMVSKCSNIHISTHVLLLAYSLACIGFSE